MIFQERVEFANLFKEDWHDKISRYLPGHFVATAPGGRSDRRGIDWVYEAPGYTVQSRVRRKKDDTKPRWLRQFTVRTTDRPDRSEIDNFRAGVVTHMAYGWGDPDYPGVLLVWSILDLAVWRAHPEVGFEPVRNDDGTEGAAYNIDTFNRFGDFILADNREAGSLQRPARLF